MDHNTALRCRKRVLGGTSDFGVGRWISNKTSVPKQLQKTHGTRNRKAKVVDEVKEEKNVQLSNTECVEAHKGNS